MSHRLTSILVSRFLLHLQDVGQSAERGGLSEPVSTPSQHNSPVFMRAVDLLNVHVSPGDFALAETEDDENDGGECAASL